MEDNKQVILFSDSHPSGAKHISYHPSGTFFATSGIDGVLRFFKIPLRSNATSSEELHSMKDVIKPLDGTNFYETTKVFWHPTGRCFAVQTPQNSIALYSREDWQELDNLTIDREGIKTIRKDLSTDFTGVGDNDETDLSTISKAISDMAWSPNGKFLAATTNDGYIVVWDLPERQIIMAKKIKEKIAGMAWNPKADQLAIATTEGEFQVFNWVIKNSRSKGTPYEGSFYIVNEDDNDILMPNVNGKPTHHHNSNNERSDHYRRNRENINKSNHLDLESELTENGEVYNDLFNDDEDDFIEDDDGTYREEMAAEMARNGQKRKLAEESGDPNDANSAAVSRKKHASSFNVFDSKTIAQANLKEVLKVQYQPFQPGSSRWKMDRRYLTMNMIGCVWTLREHSYNTISVTFFDHSANREYYFKETERFDLASLSKNGTLLAWSGHGERKKASSNFSLGGSSSLHKVHGTTDFDDTEHSLSPCIFYKSHTGSNETSWEYRINRRIHGTISSIALSDAFAQVYTSEGFVLTFTAEGGYLMKTVCISQPVITAVGWGNYFFVVRDSGVDALGRASLTYSIENVQNAEILQKDEPLDITPSSRLAMAFTSEQGDPFIYDTKGNLKVLVSWRVMRQAVWTPVFHTQNSQLVAGIDNPRFWPLGVTDDFKFIAYPLATRQHEPSIPLPTSFEEFDLDVPVSKDNDAYSSKFVLQSVEYELMRDREDNEDDIKEARLEMDKTLLRRFNEGCKSGKSHRALLGLVKWIHFKDSLTTASTIAVKSNLITLANSINEIQDQNENFF